uniref:Putative secreted protein n=1 Tax=Anopheles triannulatus TaxID=58253 RepID=A0A2M4B7B6_9DIPT
MLSCVGLLSAFLTKSDSIPGWENCITAGYTPRVLLHHCRMCFLFAFCGFWSFRSGFFPIFSPVSTSRRRVSCV